MINKLFLFCMVTGLLFSVNAEIKYVMILSIITMILNFHLMQSLQTFKIFLMRVVYTLAQQRRRQLIFS